MEVFLISNNLYENNISYQNKDNIEIKKMTRPLSIEGENLARDISLCEEIFKPSYIYSSSYSSAISSAKYLAQRSQQNIIIDERFDDALIGNLGSKSLSQIKFMQDHDFNIKLSEGESLNEVGNRLNEVIKYLIRFSICNRIVIYTHQRAMLGFLIKYAKVGYNLEDELILEYNDNVIYDGVNKDYEIIKITAQNKNIVDIESIYL